MRRMPWGPQPGDPGLRPWTPPTTQGRAVVLGGGGVTGIAWEAGVIEGLLDAGVDLLTADTMIGTSAGSVIAAHARSGGLFGAGLDRLFSGEHELPQASLRTVDGLRFMAAMFVPGDRRNGRTLLGRASVMVADRGHVAAEDVWVAAVGERLVGAPWPSARLLITAVDALSGECVVFTKDSGVPLERAMAASCAVPGIYPPVTINGRRYVDGGMRTATNVDLARGHDRVVVIAPIPFAVRPKDRPAQQLERLGPGVRSVLIAPDGPSRQAIGRDLLDLSRAAGTLAAGRAQGRRLAERVRAVWEPA